MRHLLAIVILLVLVLLCGALLSFPVYKLLQPVTDVGFNKMIPQVTSFCGFFLLLAWCRYCNRFDRATLGYAQSGTAATRQILIGFIAGMLIIIVLAAALVLLGIHQVESDRAFNLAGGGMVFLGALVTGLLVGLFEETLYRGALLGGLLTRMKAVTAVLVSSSIYSAVHFIKFRELPPDASIIWTSGIQMLPSAFYRFGDAATLDAFLSLVAFGVLLSLVRLANGSIYQCIGLHAGAVTALKIVNKTTDYVPGNSLAFMVNKYDHMLGYLALLWLAACTLLYYRHAFPGPASAR